MPPESCKQEKGFCVAPETATLVLRKIVLIGPSRFDQDLAKIN